MTLKPLAIFLTTIFLGACVSNSTIRTPIKNAPSVKIAQNQKSVGQRVRWGGAIVNVENATDKTIIEIIERPITRFGVPKVSNKSSGRFLATSEQFIDPQNLKTGQNITVVGTIESYQQGQIGEYDYLYPVIAIDDYKVWPSQRQKYPIGHHSRWDYDPFWGPYPYDPFWGPYPYYPFWDPYPYYLRHNVNRHPYYRHRKD